MVYMCTCQMETEFSFSEDILKFALPIKRFQIFGEKHTLFEIKLAPTIFKKHEFLMDGNQSSNLISQSDLGHNLT